jgi:LytS/YehU family sensor histidine kinase
MDAFSSSAAQLKSIDQETKNKVPSEVRILQSAVDVSFLINSLLRPE